MTSKLYAFDFDGVICDSAVETGLAGWKVATQIWTDLPAALPPELAVAFRKVRPVMETGYEAILIMRLLHEQVSVETLLDYFEQQLNTLMQRDQLDVSQLKKAFGQTRDKWIAEDLSEWIEMNPLFDGVKHKLNSIEKENCVIITTKQERFVDHILNANDIHFPTENIFGLDRGLSKPEILHNLSKNKVEKEILFIEDRLPTLLNVIDDSRLSHVRLFFANWGYNTQQDKVSASHTQRINLIELTDLNSL